MNKQNSRSNGGRGGAKKKGGGGVGSTKGEDVKKKSAGVTKAVQKKIDAWWERNSDALIKRTVEECGWEEVNANTVKAYKQFLQVKREMQDWENKLLPLPCNAVVLMADAHEMTDDYQADMKFLCGHDFGGKELIVCEKDDDYDSECRTFEAVKKRFGSEFDEKLWNTLCVRIVGVGSEMKWDNEVTTGMYSVHFIQRSNSLESAFEEYISLSGDPDASASESVSNFRFLNYRTQEEIGPYDTPLGLHWTSFTDAIFALYKDETLIEVKKKGSDSSAFQLFCAAKQTETMTKALNDLVNDGGDDETDYVYMFNGKRLYGFETPMSLQMKDFDVIDAIPVQEYKYKRCVCCQRVESH